MTKKRVDIDLVCCQGLLWLWCAAVSSTLPACGAADESRVTGMLKQFGKKERKNSADYVLVDVFVVDTIFRSVALAGNS